jgi:hypothetical protein
VQVLEVHLDGGAVWRLAHPAVQILAFPGLKEDDVVAVVEFYLVSAFAGGSNICQLSADSDIGDTVGVLLNLTCHLVQLVQLSLRVELCLLAAMGPAQH